MPNSLAHSLVVKRFYIQEEEHADSISSFIKNNYEFLSLGSQGPDPMFYVGIVPFHAVHLITANKRLGNKVHKTDGKKFFKNLIDETYMIEDDRERSRFQSFILGQLAHYFLDRETHPYIIYQSGFDENGKITGKYHYLHANYESKIDVCLAKKYKMNYFLDNSDDAIPSSRDFLRIVDTHFVPALKRTFDEKRLPKRLYTCSITNMHAVIHFMNHNGKAKRCLLGKNSLTALYLDKEHEDISVFNQSRNQWLDPVTGEKRFDSFLQLHTKAYELLTQCYHDILKNGFNYEVISKYLNGLNYYGLPVGAKWVNNRENIEKNK
ncbi:MAG: zinc dependent phospholipase C family protein [Bacilli bacterium]